MKSTWFILCFISLASYSQSLDNFVTLKCSGSIPEDFTTLSSKKFETDHAENTDKNLDKDFFLSTRFFIDELLLSGRVLFNDPVTVYLNKVADYILRGDKELRKKLRFYILKESTPNAFSTDQGIILFTTGLVAQLENEAQMAYILCHEISHYTKKHVRNEYVEQKKIERGKGSYSRMSTRGRIAQMSQYSKDLELEADAEGIEMYLKTEYAVEEIFSEFEVLLYSYLPFADVKFDTNYFNTEELIIPGFYFPDTINEISQEGDYDDEGSTHPNIEKRMDAAFEKLGDSKSKGEKKFVQPEEDFFKVRNLCRFENINIALYEREYGNALYTVFLLQREFPNNRFLDLAKVKALYGLAKYKNASRYNEVTEKPTKVEGESYVLHAMLKNITREQLNVIAFRHAYDMAEKYPDDAVFKLYRDDMKRELALRSQIAFSSFKKMSYEEFQTQSGIVKDSFNVEDSIAKIEASTTLSKYEKIRMKKELRALTETSVAGSIEKEFHLYALNDLVSEKNLVDELQDIKKDYEEELSRQKLEREKQDKDDLLDKTQHLGIDKLVVVDPLYENYRLNEKRDHMKSEDKKLGLADVYMQDYPGLDLETQLVDSKNLAGSDVDEYNDLGLLMAWVSEVVEHDEIDMISSSRDQMNVLNEKYGTSHFLFSGIYGYKQRAEPTAAHVYGILFVYTAPIALADLLVVHNYFDLVALSVDASSDNVEFTKIQSVNLKGTDQILKAYVYDILYQLSSEPKQKRTK
jgi:beta-barrel assembly-enhancing protease